MVALYAVTIFISATLLFLVQPMFARMVLPLLGGSPAVWTTAMVFYQAALLAGYAYSHKLAPQKRPWFKAAHLLLMASAVAALPIAIPSGWRPPTQHNPIAWMLAMMAVAIGLPFFALSATSPLIQRWFSDSDHPRRRDPYFLYIASNAGSLAALIAYPVLIEPHVTLARQSLLWTTGYAALVALLGVCAFVSVHRMRPAESAQAPQVPPPEPPSPLRRLRWIFLAFVPSSLVLGVTTYLSSEIAVIPLMWVVPLSLYLASFIVAFSDHAILSKKNLTRAFSIAVVALVMAFDLQATQPIGPLILLHLGAFFIAALLCHCELATDRPAAANLTEFYLYLAVGGVLGGVFNAIIAPLIFSSVAEYPLAVVLACVVTVRAKDKVRTGDWLAPAALGVATAGLLILFKGPLSQGKFQLAGLILAGPVVAAYFLSERPLRFALAVTGLLIAGTLYHAGNGRVLRAERSFFGLHRVTLDHSGKFHVLMNGVTIHGMQSVDPAEKGRALTYYFRSGPIGEVLAKYGQGSGERIGAVGLGAGSLAAYGRKGQSWTYFEIDPAVLSLAQDPDYFTFLRDCEADLHVVLGDARRSLEYEADNRYDVLVLDAYSSDAIPVHLVTRQALELYLRKLAAHGILAFHISNLHLDLEPVFGNLAKDAGLSSVTRNDTSVSELDAAMGKMPSIWLVMARSPDDLSRLKMDSRWLPSRDNPSQQVWTDDYSSLFSVFRWN